MARTFLCAVVAAVLWAGVTPVRADRRPLSVAVAASLADVLVRLDAAWSATGERPVSAVAGGSNSLARQIVNGLRVDVFISADDRQMDVVERAGRLVPGTRAPLLKNRLAIVTATDAAVRPATAAALAAPAVRRVAMGLPDSVPAGVYGKAWLEAEGVWAAVQLKVVPLATVRAALAAAREGRADAAIVYDTDARVEPAVVTTLVVDGPDAPVILYPVAAVRDGDAQTAARFLTFLRSVPARRILEAAGFGVVPAH